MSGRGKNHSDYGVRAICEQLIEAFDPAKHETGNYESLLRMILIHPGIFHRGDSAVGIEEAMKDEDDVIEDMEGRLEHKKKLKSDAIKRIRGRIELWFNYSMKDNNHSMDKIAEFIYKNGHEIPERIWIDIQKDVRRELRRFKGDGSQWGYSPFGYNG